MSDIFVKKLAGAALMPLSVIMLLLVVGTVLLWFGRAHRTARMLVTSGLAALLAMSYGFPFERISAALEQGYPALHDARDVAGTRWVVVLGGGMRPDETLPLSSRLGEDMLYRLNEGIRLHRAIPGSRLIICGGPLLGSGSAAQAAYELARALGLSPESMEVEENARDTIEEAQRIRARIGNEPFILVTSALHMTRAMAIFQRAGTRPIAAPTQHRVSRGAGTHPGRFFPSAEKLALANAVGYELLGSAWLRLKAVFVQ